MIHDEDFKSKNMMGRFCWDSWLPPALVILAPALFLRLVQFPHTSTSSTGSRSLDFALYIHLACCITLRIPNRF